MGTLFYKAFGGLALLAVIATHISETRAFPIYLCSNIKLITQKEFFESFLKIAFSFRNKLVFRERKGK